MAAHPFFLQKIQRLALAGLLLVLSACGGNGAPATGVGGAPVLGSTTPTQKNRLIGVLAMMSDVNSNLLAPSEAALYTNTAKIDTALRTNTDLRTFIGNDWNVVWGPVLSNSPKKDKSTGAINFVTDNALYVAKGVDASTGRAIYVAAVAGTNIVSKKGWLLEDFNVFKKVDWDQPGGGQVSAGTHAGLDILMAMRDRMTGKTLIEFLADLPKDVPFEVASTGHSLGGALSPALAVKLIEWKEKSSLGHITVSAYPLAGATPGDAQFAAYAAAKFGNQYFSVINRYDIVPNSWENDMFAKIPSLYKGAAFNDGNGFSFPLELLPTYEIVRLAILSKGYTRIAPDKEYVFSGAPGTHPPEKPGGFLQEAGHQHIQVYLTDALTLPQPVIEMILSLVNN